MAGGYCKILVGWHPPDRTFFIGLFFLHRVSTFYSNLIVSPFRLTRASSPHQIHGQSSRVPAIRRPITPLSTQIEPNGDAAPSWVSTLNLAASLSLSLLGLTNSPLSARHHTFGNLFQSLSLISHSLLLFSITYAYAISSSFFRKICYDYSLRKNNGRLDVLWLWMAECHFPLT